MMVFTGLISKCFELDVLKLCALQIFSNDAGNNVSKSIDFVVNNTMTCDPTQISNSF